MVLKYKLMTTLSIKLEYGHIHEGCLMFCDIIDIVAFTIDASRQVE